MGLVFYNYGNYFLSSSMSLPLTPPKGTQDRFPPEFTIRKYIFDTRRTVCLSYGYSEYLAPLVENADLYRAKSGEDVGGSELTLISDRGGRDIAIRPEMTPSVTRMVASQYPQLPKPIRWFSIANFYRNERPQRGRNREFWQLNIDLFGAETIAADLEIIQLSIDLMKKFGAPKNSFSLKLNHRHLISDFLIMVCGTDADTKSLTRLLDKYTKLSKADFAIAVAELGCSPAQIADIVTFMEVTSIDQLLKTFPKLAGPATEQLSSLITTLQSLGYDEVEFSSGLMRGFDYYDGIVFEVFDKHPENNRALFGGGRYNGLAGIFGKNSFPAV